MPAAPRSTSEIRVRPRRSVEGGALRIEGRDLLGPGGALPEVRFGEAIARVTRASASVVTVVTPGGLEGGRTAVTIDTAPGQVDYVDVGAPVVRGLHQVDSPVIDRAGRLYATYSGSRGEQTPVSIFRVSNDGVREPFVTGIVNATSMAFDGEGRLHVSSRFDGAVYRVDESGGRETVVEELGVACGLAFGRDGSLFVGDRSGTVFRVLSSGRTVPFVTLPPSVAAFHLAYGPDERLYVTGPTLGSRDVVYRITNDGDVEIVYAGFGRPQGLAFDGDGDLYVAEALAGASAIYRLRPGDEPEPVVSGVGLIGIAFHPDGGMVTASNAAAYRFSPA
jgi:sugar lactone lactonase YvrE